MWRPKNWDSRLKELLEKMSLSNTTEGKVFGMNCFEAGADAMLEYLLSQKHQNWLSTPEGESCGGRWIFIPEEE